jgi:hypothetical protein
LKPPPTERLRRVLLLLLLLHLSHSMTLARLPDTIAQHVLSLTGADFSCGILAVMPVRRAGQR